MKKAFSLVLVLSLLASILAFSVNAEASESDASITTAYVRGRKGCSGISYIPMSYQNCKGALYVQGSTFEYDDSGVLPVITIEQQTELSFSYNASHIRALADDPTQMVLDIDLDASVRSGALVIQKGIGTDGYETVSIATDVFREGGASLSNFFKPAYADMLSGSIYRIIVAYATVSKNQMQVQHVVEIYEVKLQANSLGVSFIENLSEGVITNALENVDSAKVLELYRIGGTLSDQSVTPYAFSVNLQNTTTKVELSFNNSPFRNVTDKETFTEIGQYTFNLSSCLGNKRTITIFITPPKDKFENMYFPGGVITGSRLWNITSDIPVWALGAEIAQPKTSMGLPQLYGMLYNIDTGEVYDLSFGNTTYQLNMAGCYILSLRNTPSDETPGTRISFSYVFQIEPPTNPYTTFNLQNLRESNITSSYRAQHWELDIYENSKLIHLCFSSADAARNVADQYDTVAHERCWDYTTPEKYSQTDAEEVWLWANKIERELAKCPTQIIPSEFIFIKCETQEVRAYEYATGSIKKVEFGIPIQLQQFSEGRYHITEILSSGERVEYDVYYADGVNRVSYSLHYDGKSYMVSGERLHCVISHGPISVTDILNRWDSEGIIKIENAAETLVLPIAQTTDITLEGGRHSLKFVDRFGQIVELEVNSASSIPTQLEVAEPSVTSEVSTVSNGEYYNNTTFIAIGSIFGIGCGVIIYSQKMWRKRRK